MKSKERCNHCGLVDSIHVDNYRTSKLVWAFGPRDTNQLQQGLLYCRKCKHMSVFIPGWFGNWKPSYNLAPNEITVAYNVLHAHSKMEDAVGIPRHVQDAMLDRMKSILIEDGHVIIF